MALRRLPKTARGWQRELKQALKGTAMRDPIYDEQAKDVQGSRVGTRKNAKGGLFGVVNAHP